MVELRSQRLKLLQSYALSTQVHWNRSFPSVCLLPAGELVQGSGARGMDLESHAKFMSDKQLISKAVQRIFFLPSTLWEKKNDANEVPQGGAACRNLQLILKNHMS